MQKKRACAKNRPCKKSCAKKGLCKKGQKKNGCAKKCANPIKAMQKKTCFPKKGQHGRAKTTFIAQSMT